MTLGYLYIENEYVEVDINRSIHNFKLAAYQNQSWAQYMLGFIYYLNNIKNKSDVDKAIHYLLLASNQSDSKALFLLGQIYYVGNKYVEKNMEKAYHYFHQSADLKDKHSQLKIGMMYLQGNYVKYNINKAIKYLTMSANNNNCDAQYMLGLLYCSGNEVQKNMVKGIDYFNQSESNGKHQSHFAIGFFYHDGISIERNIGLAINYFEEAIKLSNDVVSMYNLSYLYIYDDDFVDKLDEAVNLLITLAENTDFLSVCQLLPSKYLLSIALVKKNNFDFESIQNELLEKTDKKSNLPKLICKMNDDFGLLNEMFFNKLFNLFKSIEFVYDYMTMPMQSNMLNLRKKVHKRYNTQKNITNDFFDGFGYDI